MRTSASTHSLLLLVCLLLSVASCRQKTAPAAGQPSEPVAFDDFFLDRQLRMDFYHCGNASEEHYYLDEFRSEPYYGGSLVSLTDTFDYGNQRFVLLDKATGREIYSHHYCTLWGEWACTPEARTLLRAMPESVVCPYPRHAAVAQLWSRSPLPAQRGTKNEWRKLFECDVDPDSYFIRPFVSWCETADIHVVADPHHALDIVLLPEGYTEAERDVFERDCRAFADDFFRFEPWHSNAHRVNLRLVWAPSRDSGVTIPPQGKWTDTELLVMYYTFDSERYQMTTDYQRVRDLAAHVPYDYVYILTNSDKYGGGGIYNFYGLGAGHNDRGNSGEVHVHEFGHQFCGLGDEYVEVGNTTSDLYDPTVEPWEANLTTFTDISRKPWAAAGALAADSLHGNALPEGGGYLEHGIWRPYENCLMNTLAYPFCPICLQTQTAYLDWLCR